MSSKHFVKTLANHARCLKVFPNTIVFKMVANSFSGNCKHFAM
jgi:hypothetical protein